MCVCVLFSEKRPSSGLLHRCQPQSYPPLSHTHTQRKRGRVISRLHAAGQWFPHSNSNRFWEVEGSYLIVTRHTSLSPLSFSFFLTRTTQYSPLSRSPRRQGESVAARRRLTSVTLHASRCAVTSCRNVKWQWGRGWGCIRRYVATGNDRCDNEDEEGRRRGDDKGTVGASVHWEPVGAHIYFWWFYTIQIFISMYELVLFMFLRFRLWQSASLLPWYGNSLTWMTWQLLVVTATWIHLDIRV